MGRPTFASTKNPGALYNFACDYVNRLPSSFESPSVQARAGRRRKMHSREGGTTPPSILEHSTLRVHQGKVGACIRGRKVRGLRPSAALIASLGVAQSAKAMCQGKPVTPLLPPVLRGTAPPCSTCLLFLHTSAGKNPVRSVPGIQEAALRLRSGLLALRVRDAIPLTRQAILPAMPPLSLPQPPALPATDPRTPTPTAPWGKRFPWPSAKSV